MQGNLYGTALRGGTVNSACSSGCGTVYKLASDGTITILHSFTGGDDGGNPFAGLIADKDGNLYGTTEFGGSQTTNCGGGCGVVFEIDTAGNETVLYNFQGYQVGDGYNPQGGLVMDESGTLYGTTFQGGSKACNCGTVFSLATDGTENVLFSFDGKDGNGPTLENLILDKKGNLYGTTDYQGPTGYGDVFEITPAGKEHVLHAFANGSDGGEPFGGVIRDKDGNLYGTAATSDNYSGYGVVYKLAPDGTESVLHAFASGNDGAAPYSGLLMTRKGELYGTTYFGGGSAACASGCGTVFEVKNKTG
jgi:uncharacterized repeat protein (TIGR03803 family)